MEYHRDTLSTKEMGEHMGESDRHAQKAKALQRIHKIKYTHVDTQTHLHAK